MTTFPSALIALVVLVFSAPAALAQNVNSAGASWNASWGFASSADRSLGLAQAQAIREARSGDPSTVVYNYNTTDNRQINTNTVGAMNTGSTTITVEGEGNTITAATTSDSQGCLDGSVGYTVAESPAATSLTDYSVAFTGTAAAKSCY